MTSFAMKGTALAAAALLSTPAWADEMPSLSFTTGVDYSSGDYGTGIDTDIVVVPLTARYRTGDLRFTASVPYLHINGASSIVGGDGGPVVIDPNAPRTSRSGIGDATVGVTWSPPEERLGFGLALSGRVKLPTASQSKGLGTGKVDTSVSAELSKTVGNVTPFVSAGYRMPGDPDGFNLHNAFTGSAGASVVAGKAVLIGSYDYRESTSDLSDDSQELFGAISGPVSDRLTFTLYGSKGLSDGAPDYGVGAMMTIKAF
ncbi:transporter [Novosphingobium tardum]|uniref:Transporter n=1 Tax=Novosphingobium tardum TaxID=1538021 RepID=A0ABV8RRY3_9SPHN